MLLSGFELYPRWVPLKGSSTISKYSVLVVVILAQAFHITHQFFFKSFSQA